MNWDMLESVLTLYLLLAVGFYIAPKPWFQGGTELLSNMLTRVVLPFNIFKSIVDNLWELPELHLLLTQSLWAGLILALNLGLGWAVGQLLQLPRLRKGVFIGAVSFPNVVLLGFSVVESLYGVGATKYAIPYFISDTLLFWSFGVFILIHFGEDQEAGHSLAGSLKKVFSPPLVAMLVALAAVLLRLPIPSLVGAAAGKISQCSTALSMLFIGAVIRQSRLGRELFSRDMVWLLGLKLIIIPAATLLLLYPIPIPDDAKKVFFIISAMPASVKFSVISHQYRCDYQFAALTTAAMNILCIAAMPLYILVAAQMWG